MHHSSVLELSDLGKDNIERIVTRLNDRLPNETPAQKEKKITAKYHGPLRTYCKKMDPGLGIEARPPEQVTLEPSVKDKQVPTHSSGIYHADHVLGLL